MSTIAGGGDHSIIVGVDGEAWVCGLNTNGELGLDDFSDRCRHFPLLDIPFVVAASAGRSSTILLNDEGNAYYAGQIGQVVAKQKIFQKLTIPLRVSSAVSGISHSLFLDESGGVWSIGCGQRGQLGMGNTIDVTVPHRIPNLPVITSIAAGNEHSLMLDVDGAVWGCGSNLFGQLGTHDKSDVTQPTQIPRIEAREIYAGYEVSILMATDELLWVTGTWWKGTTRDLTKLELPFFTQSVSVAGHVLFLDIEGNVWGCGLNTSAQLGLGDMHEVAQPERIPNLPPIVAVSAGAIHSMFLDVDGNLWCCGENVHGQLGTGDVAVRKDPVKVLGLPKIPTRNKRNFTTKSARNF